jgi:hypothetical protein
MHLSNLDEYVASSLLPNVVQPNNPTLAYRTGMTGRQAQCGDRTKVSCRGRSAFDRLAVDHGQKRGGWTT